MGRFGFSRWLAFACLLALARTTFAAEIGDPAPALSVAQWIKGQPVDLKARPSNQVWVIEFWTTTSPLCREVIPHLSELQTKFQDQHVVIIGISDEPADKLQRFVAREGGQMAFRVATDERRKSFQAFMDAFGVRDLPHVFVVDRSGIVAWHGDPTALEGILTEVVTGKFNVEFAREVDRVAKREAEYFALVSRPEKDPRAAELGAQVIAGFAKLPGALNVFAWRILTDREVKHRDLDLAVRAGRLAYEGTQGKNAGIIDTYARALFESGKREEAIQYQKEALAVAQDNRQRVELESRLNRYQRIVRETSK